MLNSRAASIIHKLDLFTIRPHSFYRVSTSIRLTLSRSSGQMLMLEVVPVHGLCLFFLNRFPVGMAGR